MSDNQVPRKPIHCIKGKCFVTGQSCTHQSQIQRIRNENHKNHIVSVFVVMSFTGLGFSMYDMYIHELKYLIQTHCWFEENGDIPSLHFEPKPTDPKEIHCVSNVNFMRADLEISTGHVICNRVCDPIQRADLIVIDVSHPNPNVFYELGLAMSMGKHVLPICFSKKYYYMVPDSEKSIANDRNIECFPWMKELYQYFSLYCYAASSSKQYPSFNESKERSNYTQYSFANADDHYDVARIMYALLSEGISENAHSDNDTLMLYSEKGFENRKQFLTVIQNMDRVVNAVSNPELFRGDRIMVLAQDDKLFEQDKDKPTGSPIGYNVADITKYGINKAIKRLTKNTVYFDSQEQDQQQNTESLYSPPHSPAFIAYGRSPLFMERIRQCAHYELKFFAHNIAYTDLNHVTNADINKCFGPEEGSLLSKISLIYDNDVDHTPKTNIFELKTPAYTYLNVMATYMRYVNQVFVDTHANDIVSYFWLGVCHASGVDTVRIERNYTEADQKLEESKKTFDKDVNREIQYFKSIRSVFDVAGLWCAYINANNIDNFFDQLYQVEVGIYELHHAFMKDSFKGKSDDKDRSNAQDQSDSNSTNTEYIETPCERYYRHSFWQDMCQDSLAFSMGCTLDQKQSPEDASSSQKNIRWNIGAWDQITSTVLTKQMLHYQKSNLLNVIISPLRDTSSKTDSASSTPDANCTIYIGDDAINPGCKKFIRSIRPNKDTDQNDSELHYIVHDVKQPTENNANSTKTSCSNFVYRRLNPTNVDFPVRSWCYPSHECFKCMHDLPPKDLPSTYELMCSACSFVEKDVVEEDKSVLGDHPSNKHKIIHMKNPPSAETHTLSVITDDISNFFSYDSYGGLFLHHRVNKEVDPPVYQNDVYIMGGNGIATYAIASIFADQNSQKTTLKCFSRSPLLEQLQQSIRNRYIEQCCENLKKQPIFSTCNNFGITFPPNDKDKNENKDENKDQNENGEHIKNKKEMEAIAEEYRKKMEAIAEEIKKHVSKLLAPYFLPFISYHEYVGLRRSLELYLQEFFGRDMRDQYASTMIKIEENQIQASDDSPEEVKKLVDKLFAQTKRGKKRDFWGSYTHNIVLDYLIQIIVDAFLSPLGNNCYVEAIFQIKVQQTISSNEENPWKTIESCTISLAEKESSTNEQGAPLQDPFFIQFVLCEHQS